MKAVLVNYEYEPKWFDEYGVEPIVVYDRSEKQMVFGDYVERTPNIGNVDYDKLGYLVEQYDSLPERFLWGKTNLFKYITPRELRVAEEQGGFVPLLTEHHRTYDDMNGPVCYYEDGMYYERNNSWYVGVHTEPQVDTFDKFAKIIGVESPAYIPFAPGGNYILTRETVHKHPQSLYKKMRDMLGYTQLPAEAHMCERAYFLLWR